MSRRVILALSCLAFSCGGGGLEGRTLAQNPGRLRYDVSPREYSGTDELAWNNSGTQAQIRWEGTSLEKGTVIFQLFDGAGKKVYENTASGAVAPKTASTEAPGASSNWKGKVLFRDASGRVAIEVLGAP